VSARVRHVSIVAVATVLTMGCGYALVGRNTFLPDRIRIIVVSPFENRTTRPEIEQRVTEEVARELAKRGRYEVVTERAGAHALLEGAVADFRTHPVQFNAQGRATRVETVVTIQATLRDLSNEEVLWSQSGLLFREQYEVPPTESSYFDQETLALDEIARGAASALVNSVLEGF
jgi:TolB-like protein